MTFGFRIKFEMPPGRVFSGVNPRCRLHLGPMTGRVYLHRLPKPRRMRFGARARFAAVGKGFATKAEAHAVGVKLQTALAFFAAERRLGLDIEDRPGVSVSQELKDKMAREHGLQLRDNVHGLDVFAESPKVARLAVSGYIEVHCRIDDYQDRLCAYVRMDPAPSDKQALALALYNSSHFEPTPRIRFLTLITVIEILAVRGKRSEHARSLLHALRQQCKEAAIDRGERAALLNALGNASRQSIAEACKDLVRAHGTALDTAYFGKCYAARSELLHNGRTASTEPSDPTKVDELVARVLVRAIAGKDRSDP